MINRSLTFFIKRWTFQGEKRTEYSFWLGVLSHAHDVFLTFSGSIEKQHLPNTHGKLKRLDFANQLILDLIDFSLGMQIDIQKKRK